MKRLLTIVFLLLSLTISAQRVIENPVIGVRGMGACTGFFIDKIVLNKDITKFYMTNYHGYAEGKFLIVSGTRIVADGKPLKVISAEGITLDEWTLPKDNVEFVTHFVLNFPAIDKSVETIDFIEGDNPNGFHLYDIALTDQAAERIKQRITMPDAIRNYAANIQDNGESLEREEFTMQPATVKGKIYGYDKRFFAGAANVKFEVEVNIENPFLRRENVDLNYAINLPFLRNFMTELVYNDESRKKVANFTMPQFKEYILDGYNDYVKRIDTMHVTKRAKEFLKLSLKFEAAYSLARAYLDLPMMNARVNSTANEIVPMRPDKDYLYFPKNLDIDNIMMFYTYDMAEILYGWRTNYELYVMP